MCSRKIFIANQNFAAFPVISYGIVDEVIQELENQVMVEIAENYFFRDLHAKPDIFGFHAMTKFFHHFRHERNNFYFALFYKLIIFYPGNKQKRLNYFS